MMVGYMEPLGPNSIYLGSKVPIQGLFEGQSIYNLGTWTLRWEPSPCLKLAKILFSITGFLSA